MIRSIFKTSIPRQLSPFIRNLHVPSSRLVLTNVGLESYDSYSHHHKSMKTAWVLMSASLALAATTKATAQCDDDDEEEEEEDPYDNLPEEDEPTHCSICMTYRQGPCRPYWRKVEACTKDNELKDDKKEEKTEEGEKTEEEDNKEDGDLSEENEEKDPPCLKYMLPWIECATGYRNLYNLIEMDTNYTMGIEELEKEATQNLCWAPSSEPDIDWSPWQAYAEENKWQPTKIKAINPEKMSLWKTLPQDKDPELVEIQATVALTQDDGVLECAYAQDQNGNVIGFSYGTKPSEAKEAKEGGEESTVTLKVRILPNNTQNVTIAAAYTHSRKKEGDEEGEELESHIFKSRPFSLEKVATSS